MINKTKTYLIIARLLIAIVLFFNLQAAVFFYLWPQEFMGGFGLEAAVGKPVVRAFGLLFLMWNIPYIFALAHPLRHRVSLIEAVIMQGLALAGESAILWMDGPFAEVVQMSILRFIVFDGIGLVLLLAALLICEWLKKRGKVKQIENE